DGTDGRDGATAKQAQVVNRVNGVRVHPVPDDRLRLSRGQRRSLILLILYANISRLVARRQIRQRRLRARIMPAIQRDEHATVMAVRLAGDRFGIGKIVTGW